MSAEWTITELDTVAAGLSRIRILILHVFKNRGIILMKKDEQEMKCPAFS